MAGLRSLGRVEQLRRTYREYGIARLARHFLYLYVISAFLGLGVGS